MSLLHDNSSAVELSVKHMQKDHGLFIPNKEYLIDLEAFLKYLFTIITEFYECFYCGNTKDSTVAIRQHMISKGHCSRRPDADSEYEDFYDVNSDVEVDSDAEIERSEKTKCPEVLVPIDNELHLPSGRTLGHRSQARHYRQN
jgi:pre-60S factor REI1